MVEHSDEVDEIPRLKWPRRFPVPRDFGVAKGSRIAEGKSWPAPEGATRIATLRIYRFNPDGGEGSRIAMIVFMQLACAAGGAAGSVATLVVAITS